MNDTLRQLRNAHCTPLAPGTPALDAQRCEQLVNSLDSWRIEQGTIVKHYRFADYFQTIAFVNAAAWLSHREDHHPELLVGYGECRVAYHTHSVGGLTDNDFICAAKLDALFES